jgi:hypothetical protein
MSRGVFETICQCLWIRQEKTASGILRMNQFRDSANAAGDKTHAIMQAFENRMRRIFGQRGNDGERAGLGNGFSKKLHGKQLAPLGGRQTVDGIAKQLQPLAEFQQAEKNQGRGLLGQRPTHEGLVVSGIRF